MTREEAIEIARAAAKAKPQGYYAEPFEPHEWVIDAIMAASTEPPLVIGTSGGISILMPEHVPEHLQPNLVRMGALIKEQASTIGKLKTNAPGDTSDGYHTFDELYDHRITLFIALASQVEERFPGIAWRSKKHSDGSAIDGWFVMGLGSAPGSQITYHLPMSRWSETDWCTELAAAPTFDGHTSADVLQRLRKYFA